MNRTKLIKICKYLGIPVTFNNGVLLEAKSPYENYAQLEFSNGKYEYSEINFERLPSPEKENILMFNDEAKATKYFLIKLLKKLYSYKIFPSDNPVHDLKNTNELITYFQKLGVSNSYYYFNTISSQTIHCEIDSSNNMLISYIDTNSQKSFTTMPLSIDRGIFVMYRLTYSLYLIKELEQQLTQQGLLLNEKFYDEDIELFIK
ncbi:hypothetical protein [Fredinandcohnia onubensis]|uniref:hypothetical protein n=1 Tax=Fredinandcohnia onubensis TaxID=1571209 RepID=UPI0011562062|nr:hypothetical protein [Fredinandcohnia onubensis]